MTEYNFFPDSSGKKILLDDVSKYSITLPDKAQTISEVTKKNYQLVFPDDDLSNITITDAMACVGGNTLSFSNFFNKVIANEINTTRYQYLVHNMKEYNRENIVFYNDNYLNLMNKLEQNIVFIDPPWGGPIYKSQYKMEIVLQDEAEKETNIHEMVNILFENNSGTKMIIFKLPINHNIENFKQSRYKYKMICLKNMLLIMMFKKDKEIEV
jgi:16S rRNA G966 N2-methylase RsmD